MLEAAYLVNSVSVSLKHLFNIRVNIYWCSICDVTPEHLLCIWIRCSLHAPCVYMICACVVFLRNFIQKRLAFLTIKSKVSKIQPHKKGLSMIKFSINYLPLALFNIIMNIIIFSNLKIKERFIEKNLRNFDLLSYQYFFL